MFLKCSYHFRNLCLEAFNFALKIILRSRNLIKEINTWAILLVIILGTIKSWTNELEKKKTHDDA